LVDVDIEITPATLVMPHDVVVEVNQSGLIGETSIDITPTSELPATISANPLSPNCDSRVIVCEGDRLTGGIGVSFDQLIRSTVRFADLFSNPQFFEEIRTLTRNSAQAAAGVTSLTQEVTELTQSVQQDLGTLSNAAASSATSVGQAANEIGLTAAQVNSLVAENRSQLVTTLDNISQTSSELRALVSDMSTVANGDGNLVQNLETLSANAAAASGNLRNLSETVGSPENILMLQQTLDSARATFQNAQKITADLDDLTGDPAFRDNLRNLVNGLSGLVSSTQQLQRETALAQRLTPESDPVAIEQRHSLFDQVAPLTVPSQSQPISLDPESQLDLSEP
jgi:phospholipid/cholesterol/gamma-HCH transport system substrate-binding protein